MPPAVASKRKRLGGILGPSVHPGPEPRRYILGKDGRPALIGVAEDAQFDAVAGVAAQLLDGIEASNTRMQERSHTQSAPREGSELGQPWERS